MPRTPATPPELHNVTITISPAAEPAGGYDVEARCSCTRPNRHGGRGWGWSGWEYRAHQAGDVAAAQWADHLAEVAAAKTAAALAARTEAARWAL